MSNLRKVSKEEIFTKEVSRKLKIYRGNKTQDYVADMLGMSRSTYSRIENGKSRLTLTDLCLLSDYMNCSVASIIGEPHFK